VRATASLLDLAADAPRHVVARQQFRRPLRVAVPLAVTPALLGVPGRLVLVGLRDVVEHEALAAGVEQDAPFAAHPLRHQDAAHARRPDHARRVELHELHVDQFSAGVVGQAVAVAGILPAVAGDLVGLADAAGRQHHRPGPEDDEPAMLPVIGHRPRDAVAVLEEPEDRAFHVHFDALVDAVVLEGADHFQAGAVADVSEARVLVSAEVALEDAAVAGAVEDGSPGFQFADAGRRLLGMQLGHAPVVDVLPAAHGVGEVDLPVVAVVHVGQRRRDAPLGHHRVRLAQERLADQSYRSAPRRGLDGRPEPRPARADDQHVVLVRRILRHQRILQSCQTPIEHRRTYRSAKATQNRLSQAHSTCRRLRQPTQL
jgi:hypothetical protein